MQQQQQQKNNNEKDSKKFRNRFLIPDPLANDTMNLNDKLLIHAHH